MNGDIKLSAPGGLPGDIWLDTRNSSVSEFTFRGRVVAVDGSPRSGVTVTAFERRSLTVDVVLASVSTDARGGYTVNFKLPGARGGIWDLFVRAEDSGTSESTNSALLSDIKAGAYTVDLILGEGAYTGRSEWDRVEAKLEPLLGSTLPEDIPVDRLEWLAKRADVYPIHLAAYIQAHRLSAGRTVKAQTCYAFLRAGLPSDLPRLLEAGETSWRRALRSAWAELILPLPGDGSATARDAEVASEVAAMRELLVDAAVEIPAEGVNRRVILDTAGLSEAQQRTFGELWVNHTGTLEEFWTAVTGSSLAAEVPLLRFTFQAAAVAGNHVQTIEALQAERTAESISAIADTAAWSTSDWDSMLLNRSVTPPDTVEGADATEKRQNYARALFNIIEDGHRSLSLRHSIVRDEAALSAPPHTGFVATFLTTNPDFDIAESTIDVYLAGATLPWEGIDPADQAEARANLETLQRVYRVTPRIGRYATTKVLLEGGLTSASSVVAQTREEFIAEYGPLFSNADHHADELAAAVWDTASEVVATTIAVISQFGLTKTNADWVPVSFLGSKFLGSKPFDGAGNGLASLASILGNLDYCACKHCRSVFSPAAYLADLLKFLKDRGLLDNIDARRADIQHILLDCTNTNTPLPYIDLVNELLEVYLANSYSIPASSKQTTWTANELRLHPEHIEASVYDTTLTLPVHPWTLPFSLPTVEAQTYLRHLGVPRYELLRQHLPIDAEPDDLNPIAADVLGVSTVEFSIVAGTYSSNPSPDGREFWGYVHLVDNNWVGILNGTDGSDGDVGELLLRGRYTLAELEDLLQLDFVNADGDIVMQWHENCELSSATIAFFEQPELDRLHRFTRLQRACRIPARMLNVLLVDALGGTLDAAALRDLADIVLLQRRLRLDWDILATFWADVIDPRDYTSGERSLYRRRFLGKDLGDGDNFELNGFQLVGEQPNVEIVDADIPRILAALGIQQSDYDVLVPVALPDQLFSFANLTRLFRWVNLARALRLSVSELVRVAGSTGITDMDPFSSPAQTRSFVELIDGIRASGFSIAEIDWLLRDQFEGSYPLDENQTAQTLVELTRGLATIEAEAAQLSQRPETAEIAGGDPGVLSTHLAKVISDSEVLADALAIVDLTSDLPDQNAFIDQHFAAFVDPALAKSILVAGTDELLAEDVNARTGWLLGKVIGHLRRRALVFDTIAVEFDISAEVAEALLIDVLTNPAGSEPLFEVFRMPFATEDQIASESGLTAGTHSNVFAAWTRVAKAALICRKFRLRADEASWYSGHFENWLNLNTLPLDTNDADAPFAKWDALRRALGLRDLSRPAEIAFAQIPANATLSEAVEILATHAGWDATTMTTIATALGYSTAQQIAAEEAPARLREIVETAERLGVAVGDAKAWATTAPNTAQATAIKLAARAKYGEQRWMEVAAPLRDVIRERQRDALVDAAIAGTAAFRSPNDVFEHFLIDVEMSHCMMTSRIKQAITAVQIFLHRVFLHLEANATLGGEAIARWEWMKNYRVWEANRKVFLYPENWIEPELRRNKTPEFEALEANLTQGELTEERVQKALAGYLDKLDRVSSLEIVSVYEWGSDIWLLGRTHSAPYEWFVRRRSPSQGWGAWEEVPVQIESDAVALTVRQNRLHLFWGTSVERQHHLHTAKLLRWPIPQPYDAETNTVPIEIHEEYEQGPALPGVVFQVTHVDRSPSGEWSKPKLSEPSTVEVATASDFRLHLWNEPEGIRLVIMSDWQPDSPFLVDKFYEGDVLPPENQFIHLRAAFYFNPIEQQTYFLGANFQENSIVKTVTVFASVFDQDIAKSNPSYEHGEFSIAYMSPEQITRLPQYRNAGQRYYHWPYRDTFMLGFEGDEVSEGFETEIEIWTGSEPAKRLFVRASEKGLPAFVYQADTWYNNSNSFQFPVVYDDRKRKYLLESEPVWTNHSSDTEPSPLVVAIADSFFVCPPTEPAPVLPLAPPRAPKRVMRDELRPPRPFPNGAPGQLQTNGQLNAYLGGVVTYQAGAIAGGDVGVGGTKVGSQSATYVRRAEPLYHPFSKSMVTALALGGPSALYTRNPNEDLFRQKKEINSADWLQPFEIDDFPIEEFDFRHESSYGVYNWELFYHVPMLIAEKLAAEQRWDDAQHWYHVIFNPIELVDEDGPSKFWRIKPFDEEASWLAKDQFEAMLGIGVTKEEQVATTAAFSKQVKEWEANPFDPHAIARIRPGVYQRAVLRKYFDNLIAWADHLFRIDTIESISEATVLYIMVAQLLGPKPHEVPGPDSNEAKTFAELVEAGLDEFANALIKVESWIYLPTKPVAKQGCGPTAPRDSWTRVPMLSRFWYFCYPPNPQLLEYWDIIADRLFKIRHCQNIDGQERQLPLFEPPIDPALLVQAAAAGIDIQSVLAELNSSLPPYRFRSVHARATAFTASLKSLGGALLAALERQDGEELALLRSDHELDMLARVRDIRLQQIEEAQSAVASLEAAAAQAEDRINHYDRLLSAKLNQHEKQNFELASKAARMRKAAGALQVIAGALSVIPQWTIGTEFTSEFGGVHLANAANATGSVLSLVAAEHDYHATKASLRGSYERREEDWKLQLSQAQRDLARVKKDIIGATIRLRIAEQELDNHDLQVQNAREVDMFMRSKFTNKQLYNWMVGQLSTLYFQTYQLAFDLAKRAERAYRHELAIDNGAPIVKYGYWDSLRRGLLAGEKLGHDLERLELAYMDHDIREFELRKSVSLAALNPGALQDLQEKGWCDFSLPEVIFDLDHPGHYLRRIRAIRLTIPAVVGPYTTLGARLKLKDHRIRKETSLPYPEETDPEMSDARFSYAMGAGQAIGTSTAVQDGGLFNLDFRDERYLPFEYAGAISSWRLDLPTEVRQFDYRTISDVVVHIDYTARDGGTSFRGAAEAAALDQLTGALAGQELIQSIVVHDAFPNEWEQFLSPDVEATVQTLTLPVNATHFPYFAQRQGFEITQVDFVLLLDESVTSPASESLTLTLAGSQPAIVLAKVSDVAYMHGDSDTLTPSEQPGTWTLSRTKGVSPQSDDIDEPDGWFNRAKVLGLLMLIRYSLVE